MRQEQDPYAEFRQQQAQQEEDPYAAFRAAEPAAPPEAPVEYSLKGFGENVLSSGMQFGGDVAHLVRHPFESGAGLANTAVGIIGKLTPARFKTAGVFPQESIVDAI